MSEADRAHAAKQRIEKGLDSLRVGLGPYVAKHMQDRHGNHWRQYASRARGDDQGGALDVYALLKTLLDNWSELFRFDDKIRKARSFISLAMDARNSAAHFTGSMGCARGAAPPRRHARASRCRRCRSPGGCR